MHLLLPHFTQPSTEKCTTTTIAVPNNGFQISPKSNRLFTVTKYTTIMNFKETSSIILRVILLTISS